MDNGEATPARASWSDLTASIDGLSQRVDVLGQQMNWLVDNMQHLFAFVNQMGSNGGGIRGLMKALQQGPPQLPSQEEVNA